MKFQGSFDLGMWIISGLKKICSDFRKVKKVNLPHLEKSQIIETLKMRSWSRPWSDFDDSKRFSLHLTLPTNLYGWIGDFCPRAQNWPFCPSLCWSWTVKLGLPISLDLTVGSDRFKVLYACIDITSNSVWSDRWSLCPGTKDDHFAPPYADSGL